MNNINKKKIVKRHTKSTVKEFPLVNLYILVIIIAGGILELLTSSHTIHIYKAFALLLMIYYIHNKTIALDYLVCNITKFGLIFTIVGEILAFIN